MGGDLGPRSTLPSALKFAEQFPDVQLLLAAPLGEVPSQLPENVIHLPASEVVAMDDRPAFALRHRRQSSMWCAIEAVADGRAQACVSSGNTGALMAMGRYLLNTFPGIDRPAICKAVPTRKGSCLMLDLGANVDCSSEQLVEFALMGSVLAVASGIPNPKVGLLNIGSEDNKGSEQVRLASSLLEENAHVNYCGFVEGDGIFSGEADVVVCDGFVGNVVLKASEGVARFLTDSLKSVVSETWLTRLVGYFTQPLLRKWHTQFDPARYNGASFLGLRGVVVKSHGNADSQGFTYALMAAREQALNEIPEQINKRIADCLM